MLLLQNCMEWSLLILKNIYLYGNYVIVNHVRQVNARHSKSSGSKLGFKHGYNLNVYYDA